jgi:glycosyltransferase involved in cell wall biosynthesis
MESKKEFFSRVSEQNKKICLVMIVKDEEDVIERCLSSVAPFISYWIIVDTGSTDNTKQRIQEIMDGFEIPGEIHERPWVDFGTNRTESLKLAKGKCDYRWIIDADDYIELKDGKNPFTILDPSVDCYKFMYSLGNLQYYRAQMIKSNQDWVYEGVLHEYLAFKEGEGVFAEGTMGECIIKAAISPHKRAASLKEKYSNDAKVLEKALLNEPDNKRYIFYLAQSYRDAEDFEKAIENYKKRANMGGWQEEVYYSLYMIARISEKNGKHYSELADLYGRAWEYRPFRLEACFHAMRHLRASGRNYMAFVYGLSAYQNPGCKDILFIEPEIWQWRFLDEFSITCFYAGYPQKSVELCNKILSSDFFPTLPEVERVRLRKNMDHFVKGLQDPNSGKSISENPKYYTEAPATILL